MFMVTNFDATTQFIHSTSGTTFHWVNTKKNCSWKTKKEIHLFEAGFHPYVAQAGFIMNLLPHLSISFFCIIVYLSS